MHRGRSLITSRLRACATRSIRGLCTKNGRLEGSVFELGCSSWAGGKIISVSIIGGWLQISWGTVGTDASGPSDRLRSGRVGMRL